MSERDPKYEWPTFIERLKNDKGPDGRMRVLAPLAEMIANDPDMNMLYPYTSLWFFGLSKKPWETEPNGFSNVFACKLCMLGELDSEISILVGDIGYKDKTFSIAKGSAQYIYNILKAIHKK